VVKTISCIVAVGIVAPTCSSRGVKYKTRTAHSEALTVSGTGYEADSPAARTPAPRRSPAPRSARPRTPGTSPGHGRHRHSAPPCRPPLAAIGCHSFGIYAVVLLSLLSFPAGMTGCATHGWRRLHPGGQQARLVAELLRRDEALRLRPRAIQSFKRQPPVSFLRESPQDVYRDRAVA
jgi:hypothetical protein